MTPEYNCMVQI